MIIYNKYTKAGMAVIQNIITSKIRIELLRIFTLSPQSSFNINELSRRTGFSIRGVEKELKNLYAGGILRRELAGNQHRYQFDPECPVGGEIKGLIIKTVGVAELLKRAFAPLEDEIYRAFIYGSFATGDTAPRLGHFFGTSAEFWMNLQKLYELRIAERESGKIIEGLPTLAESLHQERSSVS